ncbi:MAG: DUF1559 domain-containing protein, partial [Planctomycetaceae bacterium]|nr:DUF1559 domain-containing protein [Planctomycetaceae bacterium]
GGVNIAIGDGSVTFVSETIGTANLHITSNEDPINHTGHWATYTGPAFYGIWSQLGTRKGGESATFP